MKQPVAIPDPMDTPFMSVEQAGQALGLSRDATYSAIRAGHIPSIRVGRLYRVPTAVLRQLAGM